MAIEIVHSRTATLVDNSNPDEIQAADWNDAHPITGDGMGLLFSNSAGDVAETMTVDMGTLTASTPLTFKQTWDNAAADVVFNGVVVKIKPYDSLDNPQGDDDSAFFKVKTVFGDDSEATSFHVGENQTRTLGALKVFGASSALEAGTSPAITLDPSALTVAVDGGANRTQQGNNGFLSITEISGGPPLLEQRTLYGAEGINSEFYEDGVSTGVAPYVINAITQADAGTLTASSPYTFKQTWDNVAQDVVFRALVIDVEDDGDTNGDFESSYFDIKRGPVGATTRQLSYGRAGLLVNGSLQLYDADLDTGNVVVDINAAGKSMVLGTVGVDNQYTTYAAGGLTTVDVAASQSISYGPYGPSISSGKFFLPDTQTELAQWANLPTNTDIDDGYAAVGVDTNTGDVYLAANVGGTIFKVQLT